MRCFVCGTKDDIVARSIDGYLCGPDFMKQFESYSGEYPEYEAVRLSEKKQRKKKEGSDESRDLPLLQGLNTEE